MSVDQAMKQAGVWRNREGGVKLALRRGNAQTWFDLLDQASDVDRVVKGAPGADPWDALERLCLGICGVTLFDQAPTIAV